MKKYITKQSSIKGAGKGLFTNAPFKKGEIIGLAHVDDQPASEIGRNHNHNEKNPTAYSKKIDNKRYIYASKNLKPGEEITTNYRMQPELEQPEDFMREGGALLTKKVTCKKCGWKWDAEDGGKDITTCHKCGGQGLVHAQDGGHVVMMSGCPKGMVWSKKDKKCVNLPVFNNGLNSVTFTKSTNLNNALDIKPLNSFSDFGKIKPKKIPVVEDSFLETLEKDINNFLENPLKKAAQVSESLKEKGEDPSDALRHSTAGALTAQTIANKTGNIPFISNPLGYLGANIAGIGHELSTLSQAYLDDRPWSVKLQESLEDIYNNSAGANTIFSNKSEKDKINYLLKLTRENKLPDGYGEERPFRDNPKWTDPYNQKQYGGISNNYIEADLNEDEIEEYRRGGYIVEEIDTYQNGGIYTVKGSKGNYKKVNGKWQVDWNRSGKYQPLSKGDVKARTAVLDKMAKPVDDGMSKVSSNSSDNTRVNNIYQKPLDWSFDPKYKNNIQAFVKKSSEEKEKAIQKEKEDSKIKKGLVNNEGIKETVGQFNKRQDDWEHSNILNRLFTDAPESNYKPQPIGRSPFEDSPMTGIGGAPKIVLQAGKWLKPLWTATKTSVKAPLPLGKKITDATGGKLNLGNSVAAYFGADALYNQGDSKSDVVKSQSNFINNPSWNTLGDASFETGVNALGFLGLGLGKQVFKPAYNASKNLINNTYKINPWALKKNPNVLVHRVQKPGQTEQFIMEQFNKPKTTDFIQSNQPGWGRAFSTDPSDMGYYTQSRIKGTRGYNEPSEILRLEIPKKKLNEMSIAKYNAQRESQGLKQYNSNAPDREFILPIEDIIKSERFTENNLDDLYDYAYAYKNKKPHWLKGYINGGTTNDYVELDLTPEEIQVYKDGGYIVEEINNFQNGGFNKKGKSYDYTRDPTYTERFKRFFGMEDVDDIAYEKVDDKNIKKYKQTTEPIKKTIRKIPTIETKSNFELDLKNKLQNIAKKNILKEKNISKVEPIKNSLQITKNNNSNIKNKIVKPEDSFFESTYKEIKSFDNWLDNQKKLFNNGLDRKLQTWGIVETKDKKVIESPEPINVKDYYKNPTLSQTILNVNDQPNRQFKQQTVPTSNLVLGSRNRGQYQDIESDGLEFTTFHPFSKAANIKPYNKKTNVNGINDDNSVFALDNKGVLHTGIYKNLKNNKDWKFSRTFMNKIVSIDDISLDGARSGNPKFWQPQITILENNKLKKGALNILTKKGKAEEDYYGSILGGRVVFVNPTTKEQTLVSGSVSHIKKEFKRLKGNSKYLEAWSLDNGTYARGLSYKDGKLTKQRLVDYDAENTSGGNGLYIKKYNVPVNKFKETYVYDMPNIRTKKDESYKAGHKLKNEIKNFVLHHTAYDNPITNEAEVKKQFMTPGQNSSHVVIEEDGSRTIYASPEQVSFHAGKSKWNGREDVNDFSIGVEFQGDTQKKPLTDQQVISFVEYYAPIAKKYNLNLKSIITHEQIRNAYIKKHANEKGLETKPDITYNQYKRILNYMKAKGIN